MTKYGIFLYYYYMGLTALFLAASVQYHLPNGLLQSLCYVESSHNINAVHKDDGGSDSLGVCQIKLTTARWLGFKGTAKQLMSPKNNVKYAAAYLHYQLKRYNGSTDKAIIAYNIGHAGQLTATKYQAKVIKQWRLANNE